MAGPAPEQIPGIQPLATGCQSSLVQPPEDCRPADITQSQISVLRTHRNLNGRTLLVSTLRVEWFVLQEPTALTAAWVWEEMPGS